MAQRTPVLTIAAATAFLMGACIPRLQSPDESLLSLKLSLNSTDSSNSPVHATRYLVVSLGSHHGNFAGDGLLTGTNWAEKADSFCNANLPVAVAGSGIYRAVLNGGSVRTGTSGAQVGWPLRAGIAYFDRDGSTLLAVANAANLFDIPLISPLPADPGPYWTGAGTAAGWAIGNACGDWSDTLLNGDYGTGIDPNVAFFFQGTGPCNMGHQILCAQDVKDTGMGTVSSAMQNLTWMKCNFGETWDSGTNSCTGSPVYHQFCFNNTNDCNGGVNSGTLTGFGSQIYDDCDGLVLGGKGNWRVPTPAELKTLDDYQAYTAFSNLFPTLAPNTYYWSNTGYLADATIGVAYWFGWHTEASAVKYNPVPSTLLRCVSDGM